jgi:peroxiredoxin
MEELEKQIEEAEKEWLEQWIKGPKRTRWTQLPLQAGDPAPDFELLDSAGKKVRLSDFWKSGPAVLMFWRHYGCSCGSDRAKRLQAEYPEYKQVGGNVVVIGQGEPERAALYAKNHDIPCPILCDPKYQVYQAYGLLEGKPSQVVFDMKDEFLHCDVEAGKGMATARHGTSRAMVDSPWQLPGEFVVDSKGIICLAYRYQYCEDWPNPQVLIAAIKETLWSNV